MQHCCCAKELYKLFLTLEAGITHGWRLRCLVAKEIIPTACLEGVEQSVHIVRGAEIDESKACENPPVLLARHVNEGVPVLQTAIVQERDENLPAGHTGQVPHHTRRTTILASAYPIWINVELGEVSHCDLGVYSACCAAAAPSASTASVGRVRCVRLWYKKSCR